MVPTDALSDWDIIANWGRGWRRQKTLFIVASSGKEMQFKPVQGRRRWLSLRSGLGCGTNRLTHHQCHVTPLLPRPQLPKWASIVNLSFKSLQPSLNHPWLFHVWVSGPRYPICYRCQYIAAGFGRVSETYIASTGCWHRYLRSCREIWDFFWLRVAGTYNGPARHDDLSWGTQSLHFEASGSFCAGELEHCSLCIWNRFLAVSWKVKLR